MNSKIRSVLWLGLLTACLLSGSSLEVMAQNAPITTIGTVNNAVSNEQVVVPVTVTGFTNIAMGTLTIEYDYTKIQYNSTASVINPALAGFAAIGDNDLPVPDGIHHRLVIAWISDPVVTLPTGSYIVNLAFKYISGSTSLQFIDISTDFKCEYNDINWDPLNDTPTSTYYINGSVSPAAAGKTLNLNLYLEGLFNTSTGQMNKAQDYVGGLVVDKYADGAVADHITVELHDAITYSTIVYQIPDIVLNQEGTASVAIPDQYTGNYYITVRHRNHIETVSVTAISFAGSVISYDYTTAADKAFGNNQKLLATGKYGFYCGDVNLDGFVNATDRSLVNSKVIAISQGYIPEDVNGDGSVNATDRSITNSGVINIIQRAIP